MRVDVYHNTRHDEAGRLLAMMDGYTAGDPLTLVITYEAISTEVLETAFATFNIDETSELALVYRKNRNRSLSVGDVILITTMTGEEAWHCASFGWKRVEGPLNVTNEERYGTTPAHAISFEESLNDPSDSAAACAYCSCGWASEWFHFERNQPDPNGEAQAAATDHLKEMSEEYR